MSYRYFQFYLAQSEHFDALSSEDAIQQYLSILEENQEADFRRAAFHLEGPKKSISILCESEKNIEIQKEQWITYLREKQILILKETSMGELIEEKFEAPLCSHAQCSHEPHEHAKHEHAKHEHAKHEHAKHEHAKHEHAKHEKAKHEKAKHEKAKHEKAKHEQAKHEQAKPTEQDEHHEHVHDNHWPKAILGLVYGIGLVILSLSGLAIPLSIYYAITTISTLMTLYLGYKVYFKAWEEISSLKKPSMASLYTISTLTILCMSIAGLFFPGFPMMLESAPLVLGFWHLGEAIEHTLVDKINKKADIRDCAPKSVLLESELNSPVSQLIPNDIITLQPGDVIPVDGVLLSESAELYTTIHDGATQPTLFDKGASINSGMRLAENCSSLKMRVATIYQDSFLSAMAKKIANAEKAPIEITTGKILNYFVPALLAVAAVSAVAVSLLFSPAQAIQCVVSIFVSACPCALRLITPLAVKIGMKKSSEIGAHFIEGKALQAAADIDAVVFDLNGTLTKGELSVSHLHIEDLNLLNFFFLLQNQSQHPVAKTIKDFIKFKMEHEEISLDESLKISNIDHSNNSGIKAQIADEIFMIGNQNLLQENGIHEIPEPFNDSENGTIYMVKGSQVVGQILLNEPLRDDAIETVQQLQESGKKVFILTGDSEENAKKYAKLLKIAESHVFANASAINIENSPPKKTKEDHITHLQKLGYKVAMVGDGGNDVLAIKKADLGIGIHSHCGMGITQEGAGMVLQKGMLSHLVSAFLIASLTKKNINQNLFISLTYNIAVTLIAAGILIGLGFTLPPALGIAFMVLESIVIFTNLYRSRQQKVPTPQPENKLSKDLESSTAKTLDALDKPRSLKCSSESTVSSTEAAPLSTPTKGLRLFQPPLVKDTPTSPTPGLT